MNLTCTVCDEYTITVCYHFADMLGSNAIKVFKSPISYMNQARYFSHGNTQNGTAMINGTNGRSFEEGRKLIQTMNIMHCLFPGAVFLPIPRAMPSRQISNEQYDKYQLSTQTR